MHRYKSIKNMTFIFLFSVLLLHSFCLLCSVLCSSFSLTDVKISNSGNKKDFYLLLLHTKINLMMLGKLSQNVKKSSMSSIKSILTEQGICCPYSILIILLNIYFMLIFFVFLLLHLFSYSQYHPHFSYY